MKKTFKVILTVFSLLVILAVLIEGISYGVQSARLVKEGYKFYNDSKIPPYPLKLKIFSNYYERRKLVENFCSVYGENYKGKPILLFGDVFANGSDVPEEKSFARKLADITQRPVYSYAHAGWGIQHLYFLLKEEENLSLIKEPKTLIYVYNPYQVERLTSFSYYPHHNYLNLKYRLLDNAIVEHVPRALILYNSYFYRSLEMTAGLQKAKSVNLKKKKKLLVLIQRLFEDSKKIAEMKYPAIDNFIILRYVNNMESLNALNECDCNPIAKEAYNMWMQLKNDGYTIIDVTELTDTELNNEEYRYSDSSPNDKALDIIIPAFAEKAKLKQNILTTKSLSGNLKKKRK